MKIFYGILFFGALFFLAYITWLNKDTILFLKLTPNFRGYYYETQEYPIGLWIGSSLVLGFLVGYIMGVLKK